MMRKTSPKVDPHANIQYHKIVADNNEFNDAQFHRIINPKVPWRAISLAIALFLGGTLFLTLGCLLVSGQIDAKYGDRTWPLIVIGIIMFIPGAYHVRIAYYAFRGYEGYSFDDIPEFN